jgi:hypothetical protein
MMSIIPDTPGGLEWEDGSLGRQGGEAVGDDSGKIEVNAPG